MTEPPPRRVLVTGGNAGIGRALCRRLAADGAEVFLLGRDGHRVHQTATALDAEHPGRVHPVVADLEDPLAVAEAARHVRDAVPHLDLLVNNAGLYTPELTLTGEGLERTFAVNVLAPFRLVHLLAERLHAAPAGRIVSLASRSHAEGRLRWDDLQRTARGTAGYGAYADSKLGVVLFTRELARRLAGSRVVATCVHPGTVGTEFAQDEPGFLHRLFRVAKPWMRTPEVAAGHVLWTADDARGADLQGAYVVDRRIRRPTRRGRDDVDAARLWAVMEDLAAPLPPLGGAPPPP